MCCLKKLEDCLVSRLGFRAFLIALFMFLVIAIFLNAKYILKDFDERTRNNEDGQRPPQLEFSSSSETPLGISNRINRGEKRIQILIWTDSNHFYEKQVVNYVRYLEREKCPILKNCLFTNDKGAVNKSSIVLVTQKNVKKYPPPPQDQLPLLLLHHNDNKYVINDVTRRRQMWGYYIRDPHYHQSLSDKIKSSGYNSDNSIFIISYLPNSTIPLSEPHFKPIWGTTTTTTTDNLKNGKSSSSSKESTYREKFEALFKDIVVNNNNKVNKINKNHQSTMVKRSKNKSLSNSSTSLRVVSPKKKKRSALPMKTKDSRTVAVLLNKCSSPGKREDYIEELGKHINLHIYGECGAPCPGTVEDECLQYLSRYYKFFLVFESHLCQYYLGSRLWKVLETSEMVPVVFGGVDYADLLPNHSYIDALNQAPESLAHYLKFLDQNAKVYREYFKWREDMILEIQDWPCKLCSQVINEKLPSPHQNSNAKSVAISTEGKCTSWPTLDF